MDELDILILPTVGTMLFIAGIILAMNTSMGGTRSDYNDGSGCLTTLGAGLVLAGIVAALVRLWI